MERPKRDTPDARRAEDKGAPDAFGGVGVAEEGSVEMSEKLRELSRTREGRQKLTRRIASSGSPEGIKPGRPVSEDFWKLPKVKDAEGLLLKALLEDREQGR